MEAIYALNVLYVVGIALPVASLVIGAIWKLLQ
jgi:hypothetical protein